MLLIGFAGIGFSAYRRRHLHHAATTSVCVATDPQVHDTVLDAFVDEPEQRLYLI